MSNRTVRALGCAAFFSSVLFLVAGGALSLARLPGVKTGAGERYFRAVHVLQNMWAPAAAETENIPRRIAHTDETEDLLHHSDKIMVLRWVADALAGEGRTSPKAPLFEAHARLALGEREQAAELLMRYVAENEYSPVHYALLSECLYGLSDFSTLLLICREWEERDRTCREDRSRYLWAALYTMDRFTDAEAFMLKEQSCLGWQAGVYAAKAALAAGRRGAAEKHLEDALERFPGRSLSIRRLWEQIRDKDKELVRK